MASSRPPASARVAQPVCSELRERDRDRGSCDSATYGSRTISRTRLIATATCSDVSGRCRCCGGPESYPNSISLQISMYLGADRVSEPYGRKIAVGGVSGLPIARCGEAGSPSQVVLLATRSHDLAVSPHRDRVPVYLTDRFMADTARPFSPP
jgi:hypothetical protein